MPFNYIKYKNKVYKYESYWRSSRSKIIEDSRGEPLPYPKQEDDWQNRKLFSEKLTETETELIEKNKFERYDKEEYKDCLICGKKNVATGYFQLNNVRWEDALMHYTNVHKTKPSDDFIDLIFRHQVGPQRIIGRKKSNRLKGVTIFKNDKRYLKIDRNQIMIMDALMIHGSSKLYVDKNNRNIYRYSEHAGLLDFDNNGLEKIIISGKTTRVDQGDDDIYMPTNMIDAFDYEYIFHTHPATPKPGGRANLGVLYEFPSISDIFHFIDHYNDGKTQGSIVIAAEGLYIVRKKDPDNKKIKMDENKFYHATIRVLGEVQNDAIDQYGINFTTKTFYSKISQNKSYINRINNVVNKYQIQIDYYPRIKDSKGHWIIDTIYVPVYAIEAEVT